MAIKAILFDLDNTLIDFMRMKEKSCEAAIDAMISAGLKTSKKKATEELFKLYEEYGMEYRNIFEKLLKKINGKVDYRIVTHGIIAYRKLRESYLSAYIGTRPVLSKLKKKYKLAIISDAPRRNAWFRLVALRIDQYFDVVVTSGDVKKQKDTKTPFKSALNKLGIKPEEALMVGDRIERDVNTAKKMGIQTCYARYGVENPPARGKSGADFEIDDFAELLEVVKKV